MASAITVAVRRRQRRQLPGLSEEDCAAVAVQAAFRGFKARSLDPAQEKSGTRTAPLIPVRTAARVLREGRQRRVGCIRLIVFIFYLWVYAAMLLTVFDRQNSFELRTTLQRRLEGVTTPDGKGFAACDTLDDVAAWVPAAALALRDDGGVARAAAANRTVAARAQLPTAAAAGNASTPLLGVGEGGELFVPDIGLVALYNRPLPSLMVTMRRREATAGGNSCQATGGADAWIRTCWGSDEDRAPFVGALSGQQHVWEPTAAGFSTAFTLGFPPVPFEQERARWEGLVADGWLDDRTLDVKLSLILVNANANLVCFGELLWVVSPTGLLSPSLSVVAVPLSIKPQPGSTMWTVPLRLFCFVLTAVHLIQLHHDLSNKSPMLFDESGRLRRFSTLKHAGALLVLGGGLVGLITSEAMGEFQLPSVSLLAEVRPGQREAIIEGFVSGVRRKLAGAEQLNRALGLGWVLATAKLVACLDFDPRLSLVSRTVARAGKELTFFLLSSVLTLFGYALAGAVMFGAEDSGFLDPGKAVGTLLGGIDGLLEEAAVVKGSSPVASVYYWSFVVTVVVLFLNIAVAILVDSYVSVKEADLARAAEESLLANTALRSLVASLEAERPSVPCTQMPCVVAYRAARRARERRRARARARAQLRVVTSQPAIGDGDTASRWAEARDEEDGAAAEAPEAGAVSLGRGSQYWLQPIAPAARMGVEQLAAVIERIADAATDVGTPSRALWSCLLG